MPVNFLAVLAAAFASFLFGAVWYSVLSKSWMAALGGMPGDLPEADGKKKMPAGPLVVCFLAQLIMALGMAGLLWHLTGGSPTVRAGAIAGGLSWLSFTITAITVNNSFQKRSLMLTVIDGGHWLAVLVIQGVVIGLFG